MTSHRPHPALRNRRRLSLLALGLLAYGATAAAQTAGSIGRVPAGAAPPRSICDAARDARARNSPAAPNLEAQCRASIPPASSIGRAPPPPGVGATSSSAVVDQGAQSGRSDRVDPARQAPGLQRVPDVVGMQLADAEGAMRAAGYGFTVNQDGPPDPRRRYGEVSGTSPHAGQVQAGGEVEILLPRSASEVGIGVLGADDVGRRDGFDLDRLRYEQITRGADIVLRRRTTAGVGVDIEASDGAVVTRLDSTLATGLASYETYVSCEGALRQPPVALEIEQQLVNRFHVVGCVRTSDGNIAAIEFLEAENPCCSVSDHKFHIALFPRKLTPGRTTAPSSERRRD